MSNNTLFLLGERRMLYVLAAMQFTHIADFMIMMPLGPQLMTLLQITPREFGWLVSSYTLSAALAGIAGMMVLDRFERKRLLLFLYTGFLLVTLFCGLVSSYAPLLAMRALAGAFGGLLGALVQTLVADLVPEERRGRALGTLMLAFSASTIFGVPLGLYLAAHFSWRAPFIFLTFIGGMIWWLAWRYLPVVRPIPVRESLSNIAVSGAWWQHVWAVCAVPRHWLAFTFVLLMMFSGFSVIPYISMYLTNNVGLDNHDLPYLYLAGGAATFFSARWIGGLSDRYGKVKVYRAVALLSFLPILGITNLLPAPLWLVLCVSTPFFILISGRMIPGMALITATPTAALRGGFMSLQSSIQQLGSGLAALAGGLLLDHTSTGQLRHYDRVGYLALIATLAAMWVAGYLGRANQSLVTTMHESQP